MEHFQGPSLNLLISDIFIIMNYLIKRFPCSCKISLKTENFYCRFIGSRAILSGPAGGVVGYALTTYQKESDLPVIGFDMGGGY